VTLQYFQPAHTDTDIYIHFQKANVITWAILFLTAFYPVIDAAPRKDRRDDCRRRQSLPLADNNTKIGSGACPLGNKADLTKFRDMLLWRAIACEN